MIAIYQIKISRNKIQFYWSDINIFYTNYETIV